MILSKKARNKNQKRNEEYVRINRRTKMKLITMKNFQNRTMMCIDLEEEVPQNYSDINSLKNTSIMNLGQEAEK